MLKIRLLTGCIVVSVLFACGMLRAVETNAPAPATAPDDYGRAFAMFYKLGLPDAGGGEYVALEYRSYGHNSFNGFYTYTERQMKLKGTGWLLAGSSTNKSYRYIFGASEQEVYDYKFLQKERKKLMRKKMEEAKKAGKSAGAVFSSDADKRAGATWKKVDAKSDAKTVIEYLEKQSEKGHSFFSVAQMGGPLLISAAHLYRNGYTNEANLIVEKLFDLSKDRKQVIVAAVDSLADSQYQECVSRFFEDKDWNKLQTEILTLLKRFRKGWKKAPAVKMLYTALRNRSANPIPPPPVGEGLTDEDLKLAAELTEMVEDDRGGSCYSSSGDEGWSDTKLWNLIPPVSPVSTNSAAAKVAAAKADTNIISRIRQRGYKSIPLLLALLDDNYLLPVNKQSLGGSHTYYSYSSSGGGMSEEQIAALYDRLQRPASRGDIARMLLDSIMPKGGDENDFILMERSEDKGDFKENFIEWYNLNKDKTSLELARMYLDEGDSEQRVSAINFLAMFGGKDDFEVIESIFLEPDNADDYNYLSMIKSYVGIRGKDAAGFVARYTNMLASVETDEEDGMSSWRKRTVKDITALVSAVTVDEMLDSVIAGQKNFDEISSVLMQRIWKEKDKVAILNKILGMTVVLTDAKDVSDALATLGGLGTYIMMNEKANKSMPTAKDNAEIWQKLLADKRYIYADHYYSENDISISDMAAATIEIMYGKISSRYELRSCLGKRIYQVLHARALRRLAGDAEEDLPPMPAAINVSDERVEILLKKFETTNDVAALVSTLSLDELLALEEPFSAHSNLWQKALGTANRIKCVNVSDKLEKYLPDLTKYKGELLSEDILNTMIEAGRKMAEANEGALLMVRRSPAFGGVYITAVAAGTNSNSQIPWEYYLSNTDKQNRAYTSVMLEAGNNYLKAKWIVENQSKTVVKKVDAGSGNNDTLTEDDDDDLEEDKAYSDEDKQKKLLKELKGFCDGKDDVFAVDNITIASVPPAKKKDD